MPHVEPQLLDDAVEVLRRGGIVAYPTETVYGLGADALSAAAVERVARLKGRDGKKPILVLIASRDMLPALVSSLPGGADALMERFWPGPLTLVLPARKDLPAALTAGGRGIGLRISSHPVARALPARLGRPVTSTSANPGGEAPASGIAAARTYFGDRVDCYLDGGETGAGPGSTVLDLTEATPRLVREGAVAASALAAAGVRLR